MASCQQARVGEMAAENTRASMLRKGKSETNAPAYRFRKAPQCASLYNGQHWERKYVAPQLPCQEVFVLVVPTLLTRARVAFSDLHVLSPGQRHLRWPTSQVSAQVIFTDQRFPSKTFLEIIRSKSRSHPWGSMEGAKLFHHVQHL